MGHILFIKETLSAWTYFKVKAQKHENNIPCKYYTEEK